MCKKLGILIFILTLPLLADYNFDFTSIDDTITIVSPFDVDTTWFRLENTGTDPDYYEFNLTLLKPVPGWDVTYCIGMF